MRYSIAPRLWCPMGKSRSDSMSHSLRFQVLGKGRKQRALPLWPQTQTRLRMEASLTMKKQALEKMSPPKGKKSLFQPDEALLRFLENL